MKKSLRDLEEARIREDLEFLYQQFEALAEAARIAPPYEQPRFNRQISHLKRQIEEKESQLSSAAQPDMLAKPVGKGGGEAGEPEEVFGQGRWWAVLVGVSEYQDYEAQDRYGNYWSLPECSEDVTALQQQLLRCQYDKDHIKLLTGAPTRNQIISALQSYADATERDDLLLFYFSGHGEAEDGQNYLIANDSFKNSLKNTGLALTTVKEIVGGARARAKIIVIDACHSGANLRVKGIPQMSPDFIQQVYEQAKGWAVIASCEQGQLSYIMKGQPRSVFTHFLLEALGKQADFHDKGFVSVQDVYNYVASNVKIWAANNNCRQKPTLQKEAEGEIILARYAEN
jgi:hypothetical protein